MLCSSQYFIQVKIITHSIFLANRNIIKNVKGVGNLKPHRNLSIFHEASIQTSQKTEKKLKVLPKSMYIPQKRSEVPIPMTNKYGKLKV